MPRFAPQPISRVLSKRLLDEGFIQFTSEDFNALWFSVVLTFSLAQRNCFQVLWDNFFRGNLPIPNERIISAWSGDTNHIYHLFKRHPAWKEGIIVGDNHGNFWLRIPSDAPPFALGAKVITGSPSPEGSEVTRQS